MDWGVRMGVQAAKQAVDSGGTQALTEGRRPFSEGPVERNQPGSGEQVVVQWRFGFNSLVLGVCYPKGVF